MGKGRLEAFSDGVIAIIITIMALELKVPHEPTFHALRQDWPIFFSYVLSFIFVGVYWANHHHLLHTVVRVTGGLIWVNLHLLFWVSLIPFVTAWLGETSFASTPTVLYGLVILLAAFAYYLLERAIARQQIDEKLRAAHRYQTRKTWIALLLYIIGLALAWFDWTTPALFIYMLVTVAYVIPERRFEAVNEGT